MKSKQSLFLSFLVFVFTLNFFTFPEAVAGINGAHGYISRVSGATACYPASEGGGDTGDNTVEITANICTVNSNGYVPHEGNYKIRTKTFIETDTDTVDTSSVWVDATKSINEQNLNVHGTSVTYTLPDGRRSWWGFCQYIVDDITGEEWLTGLSAGSVNCGGDKVLPPTPPAPDTSCTINGGNALSVPLGILDRSELPTVADAGDAKSFPITVNCTGADVTVSMKLSYSPISLGSSQAVKTSANGVGVAILYEGQPLSTSDTMPITFLEGSNSMSLSFEAVRDSAVELKDIPTGEFTASAILELTQQ